MGKEVAHSKVVFFCCRLTNLTEWNWLPCRNFTVCLVIFLFIVYKSCYKSFAELRWKFNRNVFGRRQKAREGFETRRINDFFGCTTFPVDYRKRFNNRGTKSVGNRWLIKICYLPLFSMIGGLRKLTFIHRFIVSPLKSKNSYRQHFWKLKHLGRVFQKPANANPADWKLSEVIYLAWNCLSLLVCWQINLNAKP